MKNITPDYPFLYEIEVSKLKTSLKALLQAIEKVNSYFLEQHQEGVIHYSISEKAKNKKYITLKPIYYDYDIMMHLYSILTMHTEKSTVNHISNL